jgi:thiol:disulfide interchange protein
MHTDLQTLLQNGEHAPVISGADWKKYLEGHEYVFANFFAPWCVWCQVGGHMCVLCVRKYVCMCLWV